MGLPKVIKRRDLLKRLRELGWDEVPKGRSRETFVRKEKLKVRVTNNHSGEEIQKSKLKKILAKTGITEEEWNGEEPESEREPDDGDGDENNANGDSDEPQPPPKPS